MNEERWLTDQQPKRLNLEQYVVNWNSMDYFQRWIEPEELIVLELNSRLWCYEQDL